MGEEEQRNVDQQTEIEICHLDSDNDMLQVRSSVEGRTDVN